MTKSSTSPRHWIVNVQLLDAKGFETGAVYGYPATAKDEFSATWSIQGKLREEFGMVPGIHYQVTGCHRL